MTPRAVRGPGEVVRLVVLPAEEGTRLDLFLAAAAGLSRRAARRLIADGAVYRNRAPLRVQSRILAAGDVVELLGEAAQVAPAAEPAVPLPEILYEDGWLLVADKPAGVLSQTASDQDPAELALDQMLLLALALREGRSPYLRLMHRLDRVTSGAVLCARRPQALRPLTRAWASRAVDRRYLAVVEGLTELREAEVDRPIARDRGHAWRFTVDPKGRPARTVVRALSPGPEGTTVVECRLLTGRTHQVRVHLAAIGHPVLGDRLYGSRLADLVPRPLLHAAALALPHPEDGRRLEVSSPVAGDIIAFLGPELSAGLDRRLTNRP